MITRHVKCFSRDEAFSEASKLLGHDYEYDSFRSGRAGYPIYFSIDGYEWISDLGDRLEVNHGDGSTTNIWIVDNTRERLVKAAQGYGYISF